MHWRVSAVVTLTHTAIRKWRRSLQRRSSRATPLLQSGIFMSRIQFSVFMLFATLASVACWPVHALDIELFEGKGASLTLRLSKIDTVQDKLIVEHYKNTPTLAKPSELPNEYSISLDSTPGNRQYLKAARLSGGVYVHLPQLCPVSNCDGIRFIVHAKKVMWGDAIKDDSITIEGENFRRSAIFFTNESEPHLRDALYIGSEFSATTQQFVVRSIVAIRQAYRELVGQDLLSGHGVLVTTARDDEGATGHGGDALNIIRLTFHNRRDEAENEIARLLVNTFAHELAHKLHSERLFELLPQGRIVSEGSADFMKVVVLRRAGVLDEAVLTSIVSRAYNECQRKRGTTGLLERAQNRTADSREYYDCGMIYYLALMFDAPDGDTTEGEIRFVNSLVQAFQAAPKTRDDVQRCELMSVTCDRPVAKQMLGDSDSLRARRAWFDGKWNSYLRGR